jgi:hypothetical protein
LPKVFVQLCIIVCSFLQVHPPLNMHHFIMLIVHILDNMTIHSSRPYWVHLGIGQCLWMNKNIIV